MREDLELDDRRDAGRRLAGVLGRYAGEHPLILALPRGGVPVAYEVARALRAPLDVVVVRKLGAPHQRELGIGAVVGGDCPETVLDEESIRLLHVRRDFVEREIAVEIGEVHRREALYRAGRPRVAVAGRTVIVVDDGIATGGSMRVALRSLRRAGPAKLVLAVPVAPGDTLARLRSEVDDVVCLSTPSSFQAVGQFYRDFRQTSDQEVIDLLAAASKAVEAEHACGDDDADVH